MKPIKIDLKFNNVQVKNIDELRNHFSVDMTDIFKSYDDGTLLRWLNVRGLTNEVKRLNEISSKDQEEILIQFCEIFETPYDVNAKDINGFTPLHRSAFNGHSVVAELLIAKGADVNARNNNGTTPLRRAAFNGHTNVADLLIAKGANVNEKNNDGATPLHIAAQNGHKDVAELLIAKGANVNEKNNDGDTPLHFAASNGHKDVAELLIAFGVNVNERLNYGLTLLHIAAYGGNIDMVKLLIAIGADVNARAMDRGLTPLDMAINMERGDVADFLRQHG